MHADTRAGMATEVMEPLLRKTYTTVDNLIGIDDVNDLFRFARSNVDTIHGKDEVRAFHMNSVGDVISSLGVKKVSASSGCGRRACVSFEEC